MSKVNKKELIKALKDYHIVGMDTIADYDASQPNCRRGMVQDPPTQIEITLTCVKKNKKEKQIIEIDGQSYELRKIKKK